MYFELQKVRLSEKVAMAQGRYALSDETLKRFDSIDNMQQFFFTRGADNVAILWRDTPSSLRYDEFMENIEAKNDCSVVRVRTITPESVVFQYYTLHNIDEGEDTQHANTKHP